MSESHDRVLVSQVLAEAGLPTNDVYDLVNQRGGAPYKAAIPALAALLPKLGRNKIKEGVVRALGVREARGVATQALIRELQHFAEDGGFSTPFDFHLAWATANSLAEVVEDRDFDQVKALVQDSRLGKTRQMLAHGLSRMRSKRGDAISVLMSLLDDPDLTSQVIASLAKLRAHEAIPRLRRYLCDPRALVQSEAKKALRKLER